jgi:hypothetical protein
MGAKELKQVPLETDKTRESLRAMDAKSDTYVFSHLHPCVRAVKHLQAFVHPPIPILPRVLKKKSQSSA